MLDIGLTETDTGDAPQTWEGKSALGMCVGCSDTR